MTQKQASHAKQRPRIQFGTAWLLILGIALLLLVTTFADLGCFALLNSAAAHPMTAPNYLFGVLNDQGLHNDDLWRRGVHATTFEFQWKVYEPQEGVYNQDYIYYMKQMLTNLNNQGWYVQMIPGYQYVPDWVFTNYPDVYFVNQYGEKYNPDPDTKGDYRVINAPFNPQARELIAGYIQRIFKDFDQNNPALRFDSVRVGGGPQGELRYPPETWNGHTNSYWGFDIYAQNPAVSGIPTDVKGWRPGIDPNPGTVNHGQLILNPGFEQSHPYYGLLAWVPDDEVTAEATSTGPHGGSRALKLTISTANRIHQYVRVSPGTTYNLSGWLKSGVGSGYARIFILQHDSHWNPLTGAPYLKLETNSTGWTQLSGSLTTSPSTSILKVEMDGNQPGTYYFDDLQLKRAGETNTQSRNIEIPLNFYDWYVQALTNYQNWQISEIRKLYQGQLDIVYAGKGVRSNQILDALSNDLRGDGWSEKGGGLYAASDYSRHVNELSTYQNVSIYVTGIEIPPADEVDDLAPFPGKWSAARWVAQIARDHNLRIWGENTGHDNKHEMSLAIKRMHDNDFIGIFWARESELYASPNPNNYATINDYASFIHNYTSLNRVLLPLVCKNP